MDGTGQERNDAAVNLSGLNSGHLYGHMEDLLC